MLSTRDPFGREKVFEQCEPNEFAYWLMMAASLDPKAYVYLAGGGFTGTVPVGHTWFAVGAWNAAWDGGDTFFLRTPNPSRPLIIPEGVTVAGNGTAGAHLYYFDPALAIAFSAEMATKYRDPRGLYFERLQRLTLIRPSIIRAQPVGGTTGGGSNGDAIFPSDFDFGIVQLANAFDVPWVALRSPIAGAAVALGGEVSDDHQYRIALSGFYLPFRRTEFPSIETRGASVDGAAGGAYLGSHVASVIYTKIPANW